jgi:DNA-binding MurR/RpiR family transcriptional regulator
MERVESILSPNSVGLPIPFARIRSVYQSLPPSERKVADYVLTRPHKVIHASVTDLAQLLDVSESTVVRFCQRLEYQGYQEFKILLARDLGTPFNVTYENIEPHDDVDTVIRKVFQISSQALNDSLAVLSSDSVRKVVRLLAEAYHVYIFGCGGSGGIAQVAGQKLLRLGVACTVCSDPHTQTLLAGRATPHDVTVGISYSGNNEDVLRAMRVAQGRRVKTVGITNYPASPLARGVDVQLLTGVAETPLVSESGPSRIAQLGVIDTLCTCYFFYQQSLL